MREIKLKHVIKQPGSIQPVLVAEEPQEGLQVGIRLTSEEAHCLNAEMTRAAGGDGCPCLEYSSLALVQLLATASETRLVHAILTVSKAGLRCFLCIRGPKTGQRLVPLHPPAAMALVLRCNAAVFATAKLLECARAWNSAGLEQAGE